MVVEGGGQVREDNSKKELKIRKRVLRAPEILEQRVVLDYGSTGAISSDNNCAGDTHGYTTLH